MNAKLDTTSTCPPAIELDRLVRGRLTEARSAAIADHIGACSSCQRRLDAITGATDDLAANLRECARDTPPTNSAYHRALAAAENEVRATTPQHNGVINDDVGSCEPQVDESTLDFLQPNDANDDPSRLGKLGLFGILGIVGRGGMGVVLHAYDPCLAREVAVKVIDPKLAHNEVARKRFCREARAAAAVSHDNLVAVHQVNEDEASGLPYLVMQLVPGESLDKRLKRVGKLPPLEVARLGMQAAAGLAAAHAGGLIHRDIKPGNILLESPTDRVKLTDFGLARAAEDVKLTRTGFVAGSPLYMAPEQAKGEEIDHRADLFSLGSVLYEAASGVPPFDGKTPLLVLRRVTDETPPALDSIVPGVPVWLADIVDKLLAKKPADRFQTASEVAEAFATELAHAHALSPLDAPSAVCPIKSRSGTMRSRAVHWKCIAYRAVPWVGGMLLGGLCVALLGPPEAAAPTTLATADPGPKPLAALQGEPGTVWSLAFLEGDRIAVGMDDGQVTLWDWRSGTVFKTMEPRLGGTVWSLAVSGDGESLVASSDQSIVTVWDLMKLEVAYTFPQPTSTKAAVFSPDGSLLATGDRNATIRVYNIEAEIPIPLSGHRGTVHALAFSPDGTKLASAGSDGTAKVWSHLNDPTAVPLTLNQHKGPVYGVDFSPDGTKIATTGWDGTVRIWDLRGSQLKTIKAHEGDSFSVAFGGGGKWVATAGPDAVKVWDIETGNTVFTFKGERAFHTVRFAKDGNTLATGGRDGVVRVWELNGK